MICIYSQNNTEYTKNGDAVLIPTKCEVSMTINGVWQMTLEHPYDPEERYKYIIEGAVVRCDIKCIRELPTVQQRFRIYTYTKGLHGITAIGFPIAMESTYDAPIDNLVISNKTGAQAMAALQAFTNKYTLSTDVTKTASASMANTNINSAIASGANNSFISAWGGEILYSNYDYMVKSRLGDDTAADHRIIYGRNLTNIEYNKDDSGLTTRIYPISEDGIRLNGTGYVDSSHASDYPVIHHRFMTAPYNLVDTDASSSSATAQQTRTSLAAISTAASTLSQGVDRSAYPPEYIKQQKNDIIAAVQTMALTGVVSTSLYNAAAKTIADAMAWMNDLAQPEWDWMGSYEDGWKYGDTNGYAVNQYIKIGKKWCYFGSNGNWQEPADSSNDWNWYQSTEEAGKRYGDFSRYYAHNEYVFITIDGQLKQYWFDKEGWYDEDKSGDSDYGWNGSGTAEDPWWFGESSTKYLKSCWAFIDGTYYFFDEYGYYDGSTKFNDWQWDWVDDGANPWFGNPDETYAAIYLTNQWCKIDGAWYYFDNDGYAYDTNAARADVIRLYTTGMASLATTVGTQSTALYDLLYSLMTSYAQSKYAQGVDMPVITIKVNMADLSKTTEYAGYENLETVKLGDSVECIDDEHDISTTNRVIGITYDVLRDYNSEVTIGSATASVASIIGNANGQAVAGGFDTSAIEAQLDALQDKVGDVVFNEISLVENGVAQFKIQAGENINITRSGKTWTIRAAGGGDGDVNLYTGISVPDVSLGDDDDIYLRMKSEPKSTNKEIRADSGSNISGYNQIVYPERNEFNFWCRMLNSGTHRYHYFHVAQLTVGKTYRVRFIVTSYSSLSLSTDKKYFGMTVQKTASPIDMTDYASEMVTDGEFAHYTEPADFYYQSFHEDTTERSYEFEFTATQETMYFFVYGDKVTADYNIGVRAWYVTELEEINEIEDVYYKVDGEWLIYEREKPFIGATSQANGEEGLVPQPLIADKDKFLKGDGTWAIPNTDFTGATSQADGAHGLVPAPTINDVGKVLGADGTWVEQTGGTEVEANPSGTATDTLQTIEIDGTIYEIQGGGGGGNGDGSPMSIKHLAWTATSSSSLNAPLTESIELEAGDYLFIVSTPYSTSNSTFVCGVAIDGVLDTNKAISLSASYGRNTFELSLRASATVQIVSWQSASVSWNSSYLDRGGCDIIKLSQIVSPIIYSTEEREVGVWTDNKPLYAKTYNFNSFVRITNSGADISQYIDNRNDIETLVRGESFCTDGTSSASIQSTALWVGYSTRGVIMAYCAEGATANCVTLYYTKTTDIAGSGSYNTLGVPNVHYDGNEKVIGTWFGETLYEKTIDVGTLPNNTTKLIPIDSNIDLIINYDGLAYSTTDRTYQRPLPMVGSSNAIIRIDRNGSNLRIITYDNWTTYTGYVTIQYTKTS